MLLTSCINFHKIILYITVFIPISKLARLNFWIEYSVYYTFYPYFKTGRLELLDSSIWTTDRWMPAFEMPGDLKMKSLFRFIVNCDICQRETGICEHSREKMSYLSYLSYTGALPWYTNDSFSLFCSHTLYIQNVVCFSFKWNIQQMICEKKMLQMQSRELHAFFVFEHFPLSTWSFAE